MRDSRDPASFKPYTRTSFRDSLCDAYDFGDVVALDQRGPLLLHAAAAQARLEVVTRKETQVEAPC